MTMNSFDCFKVTNLVDKPHMKTISTYYAYLYICTVCDIA